MRLLLFSIFLFSLLACSVKSQKSVTEESLRTAQTTKIYLVRHAEKDSDGTSDPALSEVGKQRAKELATLLGSANIKAIYSTDYKRTQMTGQPLAKQVKEVIEVYTSEDEMVEIIANANRNILIIGHSNTIPKLINRLIEKQELEDLDEQEYDKLFVVEKKGKEYQFQTRSF